jgi:tRNA (guanine-N7-)-methyltransferase
MRNRKKNYTQDELNNNPYIVRDAKEHMGSWSNYFDNNNPIHIEIGCGKGSFIKGMSSKFPNINFIGMEKEGAIVAMAARLLSDSTQLPDNTANRNAVLILGNADELLAYFAPNEIAHIYLNFSDPWPKSRTAKRRLTYRDFLAKYATISSGSVSLKTDNEDLYRFSVAEFEENGWQILSKTEDLHKTEFHTSGDNVKTEYETKFSDMGMPIYRVEAKKV